MVFSIGAAAVHETKKKNFLRNKFLPRCMYAACLWQSAPGRFLLEEGFDRVGVPAVALHGPTRVYRR